MDVANKRKRMREILAGDRCVFPASVFDPISARAADDLDYEMTFFAGSIASLAILGAPDLTLVTLSELAEQTRRICRASRLPLMIDADHGFGNALNVMRTVQELEDAGAAALTVEDTLLPSGFDRDKPGPVSIAEGAGKLRAAVEARSDPAFVIIGRTGAAATSGLEDALKRIELYQTLGIDGLFLAGLRTRDELRQCQAAARIPLLLGGISPELSDTDFLQSSGVRMVIRGHQPYQAAVRAVYETLRALREEQTAYQPKTSAPLEDLIKKLSGVAEFESRIRAYLRSHKV